MNLGIAGYGFVGTALHRFFRRDPEHTVAIYDKYAADHRSDAAFERLNRCDIVFIAVPTPYNDALASCDISAVEEIVERLRVPMCIKSTIPPGTTDALRAATGKPIAFSPEYIGEGSAHPWPEADSAGFVICAGDPNACRLVHEAFASVSNDLQFIHTSALAAELAKYMENSFLATKVAFVNQFYDLAQTAGVEYDEVRRLFLLDERVGASHTEVRPERGFGGKCLPKDLKGIIAWAQGRADTTLLSDVLAYNVRVRDAARQPASAHTERDPHRSR